MRAHFNALQMMPSRPSYFRSPLWNGPAPISAYVGAGVVVVLPLPHLAQTRTLLSRNIFILAIRYTYSIKNTAHKDDANTKNVHAAFIAMKLQFSLVHCLGWLHLLCTIKRCLLSTLQFQNCEKVYEHEKM
jgi:hypothetical protein